MSHAQGRRPKIVNKTVPCGTTDTIDAFDAQGDPITYQIIASVPAAPAPSPTSNPISIGDVTVAGPPRGISSQIYVDRRSDHTCEIRMILDDAQLGDVPDGEIRTASAWFMARDQLMPEMTSHGMPMETLDSHLTQGIVVWLPSSS